MAKIWKYHLAVTGHETSVELKLPRGAVVLSIQDQGESLGLTLWAQVLTNRAKEPRRFILRWTDQAFDPDPRDVFLATVQAQDGLVWHVFERQSKGQGSKI